MVKSGNCKMVPERKGSLLQPLLDEKEHVPYQYNYLIIGTWILKFILWCLLMTLFVVLEFGAVFFILSIFYLMFTNFRTRSKEPGEKSAYSVFNPNCEAIEGSLTAQQFEKELMFGVTALH